MTNLFIKEVKVWNKEVFRHLFYKKKKILAKFHGIEKKLALSPNFFLTFLQKILKIKYQEILTCEEDFWKMKSHLA